MKIGCHKDLRCFGCRFAGGPGSVFHSLIRRTGMFFSWRSRRGVLRTVAVLFFAGVLAAYLLALPRPLFKDPYSPVLLSREGKLLGARIAADGQWRFPAGDSVPEKFRKAIVRYEDKRFYRHPGVDLLAAGRAAVLNLRYGRVVSGGSTITMQTVRLFRGNRRRTLFEKAVEAVLATRLEWSYSKEEILALYASHAPFGGNVVGLEAASRRFFNCPSSELTWAESALLAVLPNAPSLLHLGSRRPLLLQKRDRLLARMREAGDLSQQEYELAVEEPLPREPYSMPSEAYHYLERLRSELPPVSEPLYRSNIDYYLQQRVNELVLRYRNRYANNNVWNLAVLITEVSTGRPVAYVGNVYDESGKKYGGAVDVVRAPRSSGSTLKPLLYAAMLQSGEILPDMLVKDVPHRYRDFSPRNFNRTYDGAVPARDVIRRSLNVPAVRMLDDFGVERFRVLLNDLGFGTITRDADYYGLSLILGGAEVVLEDLVQVYARLARQLNRYGASAGSAGSTGSGFVPPDPDDCADPGYGGPREPLSAASVWLMFEALSEVNRPEEEGDWRQFGSARKIAWKTGTSWGNRDAWSIGVTPEYAVGVWVGNGSGEGRAGLTGVSYAAPLMFDLFSLLPETTWFSPPEMELEEIIVCPESGHPVSSACGPGISVRVPVTENRPVPCPYHTIVHLDRTGRYRVDSGCYEPGQMQVRSWFLLPPAQEWYYMQTHPDYRALPPAYPGTGSVEEGAEHTGTGGALEILYPQPGTVIVTPLALDGKSRGAVFRAFARDREAVLYWHLDDRYLGMTRYPEHKITVIPDPGPHLLQITDDRGNRSRVRFRAE